MTCQPGDLLPGVVAKNTEFFSYIPVVNAEYHIIGLLRAEKWFVDSPPSGPVADFFEPLSERQVIGSDASIFDFITTADERPIRLVVSGGQVSGLVSLSDLQQLPVRAALFTLVTSLEIVMAELITRHWGRPEDWINCLSEQHQEQLQDLIAAAKARDGFVGEIAYTQFADKKTLIVKGGFLSRSKTKAIESLRKIQQLMDDLAHANSYANSPDQARHVCDVVRDILGIKTELLERLSE